MITDLSKAKRSSIILSYFSPFFPIYPRSPPPPLFPPKFALLHSLLIRVSRACGIILEKRKKTNFKSKILMDHCESRIPFNLSEIFSKILFLFYLFFFFFILFVFLEKEYIFFLFCILYFVFFNVCLDLLS